MPELQDLTFLVAASGSTFPTATEPQPWSVEGSDANESLKMLFHVFANVNRVPL